jgi:alcohol dehydrogenase class IV
MNFEFATSNRILFGPGRFGEAGVLSAELGKRAFVLTRESSDRADPLIGQLRNSGVACTAFPVSHEPTVTLVREATRIALGEDCDLVIAFGGGSVIDAGKAVASLAANGADPLDFLEVIGRGRPITRPSLPFIAIPTTAGTGSEVTRNAVLAAMEERVKVSLRSHHMLPAIALLDPELTASLPPSLTASTGLDALTQLIEPYLSSRSNPLTDAVCTQGMWHASGSLREAYRDGSNRAAREGMMLASLMGGLALANAGLGAVHGFAGPFGGMFDAPHGAICAALLPHSMAVNLRALRERSGEESVLARFDDIANILTGDPTAEAPDGILWLRETADMMEIPPLSTYGFTRADFPELAEKAMRSSSMKGNPVQLTQEELFEILDRAL